MLLWETDYRSSQQEIKFKLYLNGQESPVAPTIEDKYGLFLGSRLYALNGSDFKKVSKAFVQTNTSIAPTLRRMVLIICSIWAVKNLVRSPPIIIIHHRAITHTNYTMRPRLPIFLASLQARHEAKHGRCPLVVMMSGATALAFRICSRARTNSTALLARLFICSILQDSTTKSPFSLLQAGRNDTQE